MKKRVLSLLLLLAVVFSLLPATVLTANAADYCRIGTQDASGSIYVKHHNYIFDADLTVKKVALWRIVEENGNFHEGLFDNHDHIVKPTVIGPGAFADCSELESISLPRDCRTIGDRAFYGCDKLSFLYYDGPFDYIKRYFDHNDTYKIFYGSDGKPLKNLTVYAGRGSYRESDFPMFYGNIRIDCTSIGTDKWTPKNGKGTIYIDRYKGTIVGSTSDVEFDSLPKEIVEHTSGLIVYHWPITEIDEYAFASCNFGVFTTKSSNISQIKPNAFYNCSNLFSVALPANDAFNKFSDGTPMGSYISPGAFRNCFRLENLTLAEPNSSSYSDDFMYGHWVLLDQSRKKLKMVPPATRGTFKVSEGIEVIDYFAFEQCGITEISLPKSLKEIGDCAFADVVSLKTLTIPKGVTKIGDEAAENVESIYFYGALPQLGERAFSNNAKLYYIPGKPGWPTTPIEMSINAPGGGTYHCYPWCEQSSSAGHTPEKVTGKDSTCTEDGYEGYWRCTACSRLFSDEKCTKEITKPIKYPATGHDWLWIEDVAATPAAAGYEHQECRRCGATRYENTVIPKTYDAAVVAYEVEGGYIYFDTAIGTVISADNRTVTGADIPPYIYGTRVTAIGDNAFGYNQGLTRVSLPEGLVSIGSHAFYRCSLTTVTIPASVTEIGDSAFMDFGSLRSIYFLGDAPQLGDCAFYVDADMDYELDESRILYFMEGKARWTTPKYGNYYGDDGLQEYPTEKIHTQHTPTYVPAVNAECEKDGHSAYWKCTGCGAQFKDKDCKEQLDAPETYPALGHALKKIIVIASMKEDGSGTYYYKCTRPNCDYQTTLGSIPAHNHVTGTVIEKVEPTCTEDGAERVIVCKSCGVMI